MKSSQVILSQKGISTEEIAKLMAVEPHLVFAFGSLSFFSEGSLLKSLSSSLPKVRIVGCSTAGEISDRGVADDTLVLTAVHFDKAKIRVQSTPHNGLGHSMSAGEKLAAELVGPDLKGIFVLAPGLNVNGNSLIQGLQSKTPKGVAITGGLAGDSGKFQKTYSICDGTIDSNMVVAVGFYGKNFEIQFGSFGGWQPIGEPMKVTKSIGNLMFELDGRPALDVYRSILGAKASEPGANLMFPFAILGSQKSSPGTIRTPLAMNDTNKSLVMGGDIPVGSTVSMMRANTSNLVEGAKSAAKAAVDKLKLGTSLSIIISCIGRKLILGSEVDQEFIAVKAILKSNQIAGFYSNGEIAPMGFVDDCQLHNQTMTITRLQEFENLG